MKIFIIILIVIGTAIAFLLVAALFIKKEYTIEKDIVINKPSQVVFDHIRSLKNHNNFNKWMMADPNAQKIYTGTDGTPGFTMAWESKNSQVGKGQQEITGIAEGEKINYQINFIKPFEGKADAYLQTTAISGNQTRVKWGFNSAMKYPMNAMMLFMDIPKMLGNDLDSSLHNLKTILE